MLRERPPEPEEVAVVEVEQTAAAQVPSAMHPRIAR